MRGRSAPIRSARPAVPWDVSCSRAATHRLKPSDAARDAPRAMSEENYPSASRARVDACTAGLFSRVLQRFKQERPTGIALDIVSGCLPEIPA